MIFQNFVRAFLKAAGHRYYKRVPYMTPKGKRYRYFYRVTSTHRGRHAFDAEHLVEGTKFALHGEGESEFHGHITNVKGDQITYVIDDGPRKGEEVTTSRKELVAELNDVHGVQDKLTAEREKVRAAIAEAKRAGHGGVVRRLERRLRALGGEPEAESVERVTQGADNFETMPEVESLASKKTTRERSLALRGYKPEELIEIAAHATIQDKAVNKEVDAKARELEREYKDLANTAARLGSEEELAKEGGHYRYQDAEQAAREKHEEILNLARIDIYNKVYRDILSHLRDQKTDYVERRRAIESRIKELDLSTDSFETAPATTPTNGTAQRRSVLDAAEEAQRLDAQGGSKRSAAAIAADERLAETIRDLISNEYQGVEDVTRSDKPRRQWTVKERELNSLIDRLETLQSAKKRTRSMTAATAQNIRETTRGRLIDEMRRRIETDSKIRPTTPREQLTEPTESAEPKPEPEAQPAEPAEREAESVGGLSDEEVKEMDDAVDRFRFTPEEIQNMSLDELKETYETMWKVVYAHRNKSSKTPEYQRLHEAIEGARAIANADRDLPRTDVHAAEDALSAFEERYTERYVTPLRSLIKPIDERLTRLQRNKRARERRAEKKQRTQAQAERQARREERERKKREEQARIDEATARRMLAQDEAREMRGLARRYSEAQPTEPEPEAQPAEPTESAAPKPTPRGTGKRKITGKVDEFNRHMTTNPDSVVRKDLIERLGRDDRDIDRAVNVLGDATTTTFERRVGKRKAKIVSLIDGGFADERFDIGIGYSKLDDAVMMFVRRGEYADAVGNLLPDLPVRGESEGLSILTLLRDKIDFADLNARTDANDRDSINAFMKEIKDAWASIPDARDATNKLKVTMEEIARQKETLALEYHASRPYTQTEDTTTVSPNEGALSRGADMSEGDRKKLARSIPADKDRQNLDAQIHDGNIIGRTDGKRIHFMITEDTGDRARYGTQTGELLDDGLVAPPVSKVIPASSPNFTLSKDTIKHVLSVISSFKKKRLADRVVFTHNAQTNEQEIRVSLGAIHERGNQGEVIATIPNMSESPDTIVDMQFLKDALKLAGDSASFTLGGVERPLRIDADSGIHSVIMPKRP